METTHSQNILIVAHDDAPEDAVRTLRPILGPSSEIKVVAPALGTRLELWASDVEPGQARAGRNLESWLGALRDSDIAARGEIGDPDPLVAIDDALLGFDADELILATRVGRPHWTERSLLRRVRERWSVAARHCRPAPSSDVSTAASNPLPSGPSPGCSLDAWTQAIAR